MDLFSSREQFWTIFWYLHLCNFWSWLWHLSHPAIALIYLHLSSFGSEQRYRYQIAILIEKWEMGTQTGHQFHTYRGGTTGSLETVISWLAGSFRHCQARFAAVHACWTWLAGAHSGATQDVWVGTLNKTGRGESQQNKRTMYVKGEGKVKAHALPDFLSPWLKTISKVHQNLICSLTCEHLTCLF